MWAKENYEFPPDVTESQSREGNNWYENFMATFHVLVCRSVGLSVFRSVSRWGGGKYEKPNPHSSVYTNHSGSCCVMSWWFGNSSISIMWETHPQNVHTFLDRIIIIISTQFTNSLWIYGKIPEIYSLVRMIFKRNRFRYPKRGIFIGIWITFSVNLFLHTLPSQPLTLVQEENGENLPLAVRYG